MVRKAEMVIKRDDETTSRRQKRYASLSKKMKEGVDKNQTMCYHGVWVNK